MTYQKDGGPWQRWVEENRGGLCQRRRTWPTNWFVQLFFTLLPKGRVMCLSVYICMSMYLCLLLCDVLEAKCDSYINRFALAMRVSLATIKLENCGFWVPEPASNNIPHRTQSLCENWIVLFNAPGKGGAHTEPLRGSRTYMYHVFICGAFQLLMDAEELEEIEKVSVCRL